MKVAGGIDIGGWVLLCGYLLSVTPLPGNVPEKVPLHRLRLIFFGMTEQCHRRSAPDEKYHEHIPTHTITYPNFEVLFIGWRPVLGQSREAISVEFH